ncbi:MAG: DUF3306 domain-containing protein [Betaproteobacteria bacterium]
MADTPAAPEGFSLKRWSRRKLEAARATTTEAVAVPVVAVPATAVDATPIDSPAAAPSIAAMPALPAVESLTADSDYAAFMHPKVDEAIKRAALKKLFTDPRFNVMDGLDIYIGDYTQSDPLPDGMLDRLGKVYAAVKEKIDDDAAPPDAALPPADASSDIVCDDTAAAPAAPSSAELALASAESAPLEMHVPVTDAPPMVTPSTPADLPTVTQRRKSP